MNEEFQQDPGLQEQAAQDQLDRPLSNDDPAQGTPNPNQLEPIRANPSDLSDDELTNLAVKHIKSLGGDVQFPDANQPAPTRTSPSGVDDALAAQQFDQLARTVAVNLTQQAGASGAAQEVYDFITQLGPDSVAAYQTNPLFHDMVDVKIDSIVSGHSKGLEERDKLKMPASEEVGGSTEKELRAGLKGHRQAFERAGLSEHMSFDDFIRDLEL